MRERRSTGAAEGERVTETLRLKEHGWTHSEVGLQAPVTEQIPVEELAMSVVLLSNNPLMGSLHSFGKA